MAFVFALAPLRSRSSLATPPCAAAASVGVAHAALTLCAMKSPRFALGLSYAPGVDLGIDRCRRTKEGGGDAACVSGARGAGVHPKSG